MYKIPKFVVKFVVSIEEFWLVKCIGPCLQKFGNQLQTNSLIPKNKHLNSVQGHLNTFTCTICPKSCLMFDKGPLPEHIYMSILSHNHSATY